MNDDSKKYIFRINAIPGAFGEASVRRSVAEARTGSKSILFTSSDVFTINKELESAETEYAYDKHKDFIFLRGISGSAHSVLTGMDYSDINQMVESLRGEKEFFYGFSSGSIVSKLSVEAIIKHYNLTNGKPVAYKNQSELLFSLIKKEINFSVSTPDFFIASGEVKQLLTSSLTRNPFHPQIPTGLEKGITNFVFAPQTFFAIPKEFADFGREIEPSINRACNHPELYEMLQKIKRISSCITGNEVAERIKSEYAWFIRNK